MKTRILIVIFISCFNILLSQVPDPVLRPGEYWTKLFSASYDFQSNGSIRYIVQDVTAPFNLFAVLMGVQDTSLPGNTGRNVFFAYSADYGRTWDKNAIDNNENLGFPNVNIRDYNPVITVQKFYSRNSLVYSDAVFGAGSFSQIGDPTNLPFNINWPQIAITTNRNIVIAGSDSSGNYGSYSLYTGTLWSITAGQLPNSSGKSGNYTVVSGPNGVVAIFGIDHSSPSKFGNRLWLSENNGVDFTLQTGSNAPPPFIISGTDTLASYIVGGRDGIYFNNQIHLVYCVHSTNPIDIPGKPYTKLFKKTKILHWSLSTGIDTVASVTNIPQLSDTLTQFAMAPLCQPSIGIFSNYYLSVFFTCFLKNNKQLVDDGTKVNAGEIFGSIAIDNGNRWSIPANYTYTPNVEEKHPSLINNFIRQNQDTTAFFCIRDLKAGSWIDVPSWGKAPVYGIYKKIFLSFIDGINNQSEISNQYLLFQNYPNPFNPTTTISYNLQKTSFVELKIFNVLGEEVRVLISEEQTKGTKEIQFDAGSLPSGVYFYTLTAGDFKDSKPMVIIK